MDKEIRMSTTDLEIREQQENNTKTISGYAVRWDQPSIPIMGMFEERFSKGAFTESLTNDKQKALWSHNPGCVLGSTKNNTLRINEDDIGLRFEVDLPDNSWGNDAYISIKRGDVDGVSFGFKSPKDGNSWDDSDPNMIKRTITKAKLFEISPTPFPAYPQSQVQARNIDSIYQEHREEQPQPIPDTESGSDPPGALEEQRKEFHNLKSKIYQTYKEEQ